ncbi:hypothetical protein RB653_008997 [Dictyostelium firmibasis]|uniref:Uncharacterized protein n=1 Tax=Dictyostelium firmibasis TaxID=79012 RepID=A0AAN7YSL6_9MYCE
MSSLFTLYFPSIITLFFSLSICVTVLDRKQMVLKKNLGKKLLVSKGAR